ncbi:MAG: DUF29 domain-containing protein, partial [Leptospiraceae bacterium]|nr:DUF29 domain-containing protein [Leptospiraceae bacterium]
MKTIYPNEDVMQQIIDLKKLYEEDENLWLFENAKLLREGKLDLADIEHIAEFLEDMGRRDFREVLSRLKILIMHLLKWMFQKEKRSNSWEVTIFNQRDELNFDFETSKNLENYAKANFEKIYRKSRQMASKETGLPLSKFPEEPPFTFEQVVN